VLMIRSASLAHPTTITLRLKITRGEPMERGSSPDTDSLGAELDEWMASIPGTVDVQAEAAR